MDHYQIISSNFQATIESIAMSVDDLAQPLGRASEIMGSALLEDRKILCCGAGPDGALGMLFTANLLDHFERERPALPALCLTADGASLSAIANSSGMADIFSRQVRALGQSGDVLFCIDSNQHPDPCVQRAIQAAAERGLVVVSLAAGAGSGGQEDVIITVNASRRHQAVELYTMIINSLCELIDHKLFGPTHQENQ